MAGFEAVNPFAGEKLNTGYPDTPLKEALNRAQNEGLNHFTNQGSIGINTGGIGASMDFLGGERDLRSFNRAHSHSGIVKFLRILLPLTAIAIILILFGAYFWSQASVPDLKIKSTAIVDSKMVMKNPELNGVDKDNRPYNLSAREAITDPVKPRQVELLGIDANVPMEEGLFAKILAGTGFYDADAKLLNLGGEVDVKTDNGMTMNLQDADIDIGAGSLQTSNPVLITTQQAKISADRMRVEGNGKSVVFESRVKMTLYPDKIDQAGQSTAGKSQ